MRRVSRGRPTTHTDARTNLVHPNLRGLAQATHHGCDDDSRKVGQGARPLAFSKRTKECAVVAARAVRPDDDVIDADLRGAETVGSRTLSMTLGLPAERGPKARRGRGSNTAKAAQFTPRGPQRRVPLPTLGNPACMHSRPASSDEREPVYATCHTPRHVSGTRPVDRRKPQKFSPQAWTIATTGGVLAPLISTLLPA